MNQQKTIAAIATPTGKSALAILRLSGRDVFEIVGQCLEEKKKFESAAVNTVYLYTIINPQTKTRIDESTAIKYSAPRSFTGENMVEIICHGGPRIVEEISAALLAAGAYPAGRGEFSLRAFNNGKIDILRAEAIKGLIESTGDFDLACARKQYNEKKDCFKGLRERIIASYSTIEAEIEFGVDDDSPGNKEKRLETVKEIKEYLEKEINKREKIRNVENYFQIVIAGPANAGKSSLFNLLLEQERSIVHSEPGTTRDLISESVWICGYQTLLIDSAGIRETNKVVEREGIQRSRDAMEKATIIVWVTGTDTAFSNEEIEEILSMNGKETICVINKTDLSPVQNKKEILNRLKIESIEASVKEKKNIGSIIKKIEEKLKTISSQIEVPDLILNKRQETLATLLIEDLKKAIILWETPEIAAEYLKKGISLFDELFGKIDNEETLATIFNTFCVGK